eukprot:scaffold24884_cov54-Attheya_sp.AAC.6
MGWSSKLAAKRRRRIVEEFLGDSDESEEADAYSIESDGVSAIEHENEDPHEVAAEASEDSNKDSLVQMNRNDSLVTQPSPQMDKKSNKRTGSTGGLDSLATLAAQEIGTSHTISEKSIDNNLVVSFNNSPPDQGNHTSSPAVLVEDPTKSTRTTDVLDMNPGSTLENPPVVDRSECPETQQQGTFADVSVVPDKSETTKKKFSRLKKRKNKSTLNDVSLSSTDVELEPKVSSVEFETKKTVASNEVKTNEIPCNIDLTTGDANELEPNVLREPEASTAVVSSNNNDYVVTKQQQVVKRKRRKVATSVTGVKEPKAPPKEEAIPQPRDGGGKRSDVSGGVVMKSGSEKVSKGDIHESSHSKKRAAEPDSTQPVLKKKIKLTYQDQVLKHMLIACKPFSMKTLAMETRSTTEALHHLMLSLVDKGLLVKKEFVSGKGAQKSEQQMVREQCPRRMKMRINAMRSEWKKRKDKTTDFVEMLADGMEKKVKDVIKLLDVETDESEGVKMPPKHMVDAE